MIEVRGRKFRNYEHLYEEYERERQKAQATEAPEPEQAEPESEDQMIRRERSEALDRAHEPTEKAAFESGVRLFGKKAMQDWERWHDQ